MKRIVVGWAGPSVVGLAVNVLHFDEAATGISAGVLAAYQNLGQWLPQGTVITVPDNGEFIDETNGALTGVWTEAGTGGTTTGSGASTAAAGVGACVTWATGQVVGRRRLRGRTFIVPLSTVAYEANGTLVTGTVTSLNAFAQDLIDLNLEVFHRPTSLVAADGVSWPVTSASVRDRVAVLRSRRD